MFEIRVKTWQASFRRERYRV